MATKASQTRQSFPARSLIKLLGLLFAFALAAATFSVQPPLGTEQRFTVTSPERVETELYAVRLDINKVEIEAGLEDIAQKTSGNSLIALPSRHISSASCTITNSNQGQRSVQPYRLAAGLAFEVIPGDLLMQCRLEINGPGRISVRAADAGTAAAYDKNYSKKTTIVESAMLSLAALFALVGLIARDRLILLFSFWILCSQRMAIVTLGADLDPLGFELDVEELLFSRKLTLFLFGLSTCLLFDRLIACSFNKQWNKFFKIGCYIPCLVVMAALPLSYNAFLPIAWVATGIASCILFACLIHAWKYHQSNMLLWYTASWIALLSSVWLEIAYAAVGLPLGRFTIDAASGAISASLATAVALAELLISQKSQKTQAIRDMEIAQAKLAATYANSPIALCSVGENGVVDLSNGQFKELSDQLGPELGSELVRKAISLSENKDEGKRRVELQSDHGRWVIEVAADKTQGRTEIALVDITAKHEADERLRYLASNDPLTGVFNRVTILQALQEVVDRCSAKGESFEASAAMIDIDDFSRIISNFGNARGDEILAGVAAAIKAGLPPDAKVGRLSADTFLAVFTERPNLQVHSLIKDCLEGLNARIWGSEDQQFYAPVSAGVFQLAPGMSIHQILNACDSALKRAKAGNGAGLICYSHKSPAWTAYCAEAALVEAFAKRIPTEKLFLVFQPIFDLKAPHGSLSYEVLLRLKGDDGEVISPAAFIPAIEKAGLMSQVDRWVVNEVYEFLKNNPKHLAQIDSASINLSGASINDMKFLSEVRELIYAHPEITKKICFEITETVVLNDIVAVSRFVEQVRKVGARFALDDFGAGYSSFGYLTNLRVDVIKLDGSLIKDCLTHRNRRAIIEAIAQMAKGLGLSTVAEWVEDPETIEFIKSIGIQKAQGWALSRPVSPMQMVQWSSNWEETSEQLYSSSAPHPF